MPMLPIAQPGRSGISGGCSGFSTKETMRSCSSTAMMPSPVASATGSSTHATVTSAPLLTCWTSMRS